MYSNKEIKCKTYSIKILRSTTKVVSTAFSYLPQVPGTTGVCCGSSRAKQRALVKTGYGQPSAVPMRCGMVQHTNNADTGPKTAILRQWYRTGRSSM